MAVRLFALGGLGEVGMNCMVFEHSGSSMMIDCGVTFPGDALGADVVHPSFAPVRDRNARFKALVITHGHEDHIGAVPYLLQSFDVPVYGPRYALSLVRDRLKQTRLPNEPKLIPMEAASRIRVGPFEVEPIRVTHSIPDAYALAIRTPEALVVHSGDFKIDPTPPDGEHFDAARLGELGREGVDLLLSDSTNVDEAGHTGSEATVAGALLERVRAATGRVIASLFASNIYRIQALFEAAELTGRGVLLLGRSLHNHVRVASELGLLGRRSEALLITPQAAASTAPNRLLAIVTGSQGEGQAALARLAAGTHPQLTLEPGDDVLLSSRVIPGNERAVHRIVDDLERQGVRVLHRRCDPELHVSGHACREEQRRLLQLIDPGCFLPVHGTFHHLSRHAELARSQGVDQVQVVENGTVVELDATGLRAIGNVEAGRVFRHAGVAIDRTALHARRMLAGRGLLVIALKLDPELGLLAEPRILMRGVLDEPGRSEPSSHPELPSGAALQDEVLKCIRATLKRLGSANGAREIQQCEQAVSKAVARLVRQRLGWAPVTETLVTLISR
ncbi:MAG: ribonuclease J [Proteobacteria bacterium]|nr:ribonuclease J [Pseudomonadota bacterium]